jgi:hypothetical protein
MTAMGDPPLGSRDGAVSIVTEREPMSPPFAKYVPVVDVSVKKEGVEATLRTYDSADVLSWVHDLNDFLPVTLFQFVLENGGATRWFMRVYIATCLAGIRP